VILALAFSDSVGTLFAILPDAVLGVILFLTGAQLALGSDNASQEKTERFIIFVTAACSVWNVALGFVAGLSLSLLRRFGQLRV
jgi:MFS superfamily sulfate permease-like transporter